MQPQPSSTLNAHAFGQDDSMIINDEEDQQAVEHGEIDTEEEDRETLQYEGDEVVDHHDYREELLAQAAKAVGATYDYEPACGSTPLDVTAVHEDQLSWGGDRKHRPIQLLLFYHPTAVNVPKQAITFLKYDGKLLLDVSGKALRDLPNLPLVISSEMEFTDIIARMPVKVKTINTAGQQALRPVFGSGTVGKRAPDFRIEAGLVAWNSKKNGKDPKIERFLDDLRSSAGKAKNQAIGRDLTDPEKASIAQLDLGTRPECAKAGRDPTATQKYRDKMRGKPNLTFDFDCHEERPETPEEIQEVQKSLQRTYEDFAFYTDEPLEIPNPKNSYLDQWNNLQLQINEVWVNDKTKKTEPSQLFALGKWGVSFDNWGSAPQAYLTYLRE